MSFIAKMSVGTFSATSFRRFYYLLIVEKQWRAVRWRGGGGVAVSQWVKVGVAYLPRPRAPKFAGKPVDVTLLHRQITRQNDPH